MKENLIVPVYVDTNALLDLLASIEGGFSLVEKVTSRNLATLDKDRSGATEIGTEFGIPNVLSLLKINFGGTLKINKGEESEEERETVRYHTYGSLLHRLRLYLASEKMVKVLDDDNADWNDIGSSDFVEIRGLITPNPIADSLGRMDRLINIVQIVSGLNFGSSGQQAKSGKAQGEKSQMNQIHKFIQGIQTDIEKDNIRVFVIKMTPTGIGSAVVLLYTNYLRDQTMTEIVHKEYRLLGKVVRKIEKDSDQKIDLLQGTGLGGIGTDQLNIFLDAFNQIEGMNLPKMVTEVDGPALEIVPIAIYI